MSASFQGMGVTRWEVHGVVEAFISMYSSPMQAMGSKHGPLSELQAGLRSATFVQHLKALPPSTFQSLVDVVARMAINMEASRLEDDMLAILCEVTKGALVGYPTPPLAKLLQALIHTLIRDILHDADIESEEQDSSFLLHLQTLAGCLHGNVGVRLFVAELPERKELVRTLAVMLNRTDDASVLIYSMSILARLVLSEPVGQKLFQTKNIEKALALISPIVSDKDNTVLLLSYDNSSTKESVSLQMACVDLLADLATQPWILAALEASEELHELTQSLLTDRFHMQESSVLHLQVTLYYLSTLVSLSHRFRRDLVQRFPSLSQTLPVVLHPVQSIAIAAAQFFVAFLGEDKAVVDALIDTCPEGEPSTLQPTLVELFRFVHTTIATLVRDAGDVDTDFFLDRITSPDYDHAVHACHVLTRLSQDKRVWAMSVALVNMTQLTSLAQREAHYMQSLSSERCLEFTPRFSLAFLTLIGTLLLHDDLPDESHATLREFNHVLQIPDVAAMISRGLCQCDSKHWTYDVLHFLRKFLSQSKTKAFHERISLMTLADGLYTYSQRMHDVVATARTAVATSDAAMLGVTKQLDLAKAEHDVAKRAWADQIAQDDERQQRREAEMHAQLAAKDAAYNALQKKYEAHVAHLQKQLDVAAHELDTKNQALEKKQRALHDNRLQRCSLEEENNELKRKLHVLEMRIDEVAEAHARTRHDMMEKEQARRDAQIEFESISEAYAAQSVEHLALQEELAALQVARRERDAKFTETYKQLVLLAKAHTMQSEEFSKTMTERDQLEVELSSAQESFASLSSRFESQQLQLQTYVKEKAALDGTIARYQQHLQDEQDAVHALRRERDDAQRQLQGLHAKFLAKEREVADACLQLQAKDATIRDRNDDVKRLKHELQQHAELQAMIHKLSSHNGESSMNTTLSQRPAPPPTAYVPDSQYSQ
ncbi:hypothetical protein SPRG_05604 [Saprolegnia parasitica CBS 223.65]|uniref:CIP2A N-terminal domain-containing protein n=1 Tax=Saprolegnia parasitica (strain CBS 223.65) TaxID=695850 RepID=A0A067CS89_SAPPC|nr:hypothetical protein SPRG_05604 [Saprolegnia parasitica CBS 223.65]KDO29652.1 hypothetical protein SPRG_05604 [Saprolegnia parasitica CBS 223.65]|eukprot:XP_012199711.1 hypothetical protein SPRG_05604 [Saprolegnia parasitica CBS 223.65]